MTFGSGDRKDRCGISSWSVTLRRRPDRVRHTTYTGAFSNDDSLVVTASADHTAQIWRTSDDTAALRRLFGHTDSALLRTISANLPNCLPSEARERLLFEDPTQAQSKHAACQAIRAETR